MRSARTRRALVAVVPQPPDSRNRWHSPPREPASCLPAWATRPSGSSARISWWTATSCASRSELAEVAPGDAVVEIGPGPRHAHGGAARGRGRGLGRGTRPHPARPPGGGPRDPARRAGCTCVEGDAVEHPLAGLPPRARPGCKVVANLPYAISTPWMDAVLSGPLPGRMVLMLQREAADRYLAAPAGHQGLRRHLRSSSRRPMTPRRATA